MTLCVLNIYILYMKSPELCFGRKTLILTVGCWPYFYNHTLESKQSLYVEGVPAL
jgi:hypothetical protein